MKRQYRPVNPRSLGWLWAIFALAVAGLAFAVWGMTNALGGSLTMRYELTAQSLEIPFGLSRAHLERSAVTRVQRMTLTGGSRLFGTSLPGLQQGRWRFNETGPVQTYTTLQQKQPVIVLFASPEPFVISPADPEGFLKAWNSGGTGVFKPVPSNAWVSASIGVGVIGLLTVILVPLFISFAQAPKRMVYELDDQELVLRLSWFSKARIPLQSIRSVRVDSPKGHPLRLWGGDVPGFYWGRFSWKAVGRNLRLFATELRPMVFIETEDRIYGITPAEREEFVADLNQRLHR